ncbi:hypothetical protein BU25DRAFT_459654 [Macroventuria anomochaeta]|uniref:Uncharacterized protein n=1 Tax=Macroventuria anomochaeta TaxID=301207 RepID=A0ACB6RWL0_9PLEO|nr:uncharacterized protein BU25DRAFT_459654 [Macroventuria anomochaeta]KAF2626113.1 hypothetical protein BU25DRAFT_459654 [Macroventuria anomochaeta]
MTRTIIFDDNDPKEKNMWRKIVQDHNEATATKASVDEFISGLKPEQRSKDIFTASAAIYKAYTTLTPTKGEVEQVFRKYPDWSIPKWFWERRVWLPIGKKCTKIQRRWIAMLVKYDKFTAMKASFDNLPPEILTEEMVALKTAIHQHFAAPELTEAFEEVYAVHPDWERPEWFMEKKGTTV